MIVVRRHQVIEQLGLIVLLACLLNVALIAIPGYYSHDELDWLNLIGRRFHGWDLFLADYQHSPFFRPLGTFIISAVLRFPPQPLASHLALVLLQSLSCCLLFLLVRCFRPDRALAAAILFAVMPGTAYAAGWVAAFFDLQFTFFALCSLAAGVQFWRGGPWPWCALSIIALAAGMLCKEPAITIPLAGLVLAICDRARAAPRRVVVLGGAAAGVVAIYALMRLPVLLHVGQSAGGGYAFGSVVAVLSNVLSYIVFPFAAEQPEMPGSAGWGQARDVVPLAAQALLLVMLWVRCGKTAPLLYLFAYFVPLLPVLIISKHETQYIYATSIALSVALAFVWDKSPIPAVATTGIALILIAHTVTIQRSMYKTGVCQTRALTSMQAVLPLVMPAGPPVVFAPADTPWWVMARAVFQNSFRIGEDRVSVELSHQPAGATMQFGSDCSVTAIGKM